MWFQNAVIYALDVETFMDSDGDGVGDFQGLIERIDHLESLGVTCVWLLPFQPSPNHDDGYDITDYYGVDPRFGSPGDFAEFSHALNERGIRLIMDLAVNHTSEQHPWFRAAVSDPRSRFRDYYYWSKEKPPHAEQGMVFPGQQETTWTWSEEAGAHYFHRFYHTQPDLNIANPAVRREILRIIEYWLDLGVSGFRVDAAPFLIELTDPTKPGGPSMYGFLDEMRKFLSWRKGDAVLLAEANVAPDVVEKYFGDGHRMHMLFDFLVNQPLFLALARQDAAPLVTALARQPDTPSNAAWAQFLRNHDELDLGRLTDSERGEVFATFAPDPDMRLFGRGIRRRLSPMLNNDPRRDEMAHSLIFSLPGAQVIRYGDEIGMGDDLALPGRRAVRTPMQWSKATNAGFSTAAPEKLTRPVVRDGPFGYERVNVETQARDPQSLLNRVERLIHARRQCREVGFGRCDLLDSGDRAVFAHRMGTPEQATVMLHNLCGEERQIPPPAPLLKDGQHHELIADRDYPEPGETLTLAPYGYRWFRVDPVHD